MPRLPSGCDDRAGGRRGSEGNKDEEGKQAKECKSSTPRLKGEVIPLGLGHPAPHPLFMSLQCATQDLQLGDLSLWMLEGSERLLDQMFQFYPWILPLSDRKDLTAGFMLPSDLMVESEKCFGVKNEERIENEFEQCALGHDSTETKLAKLLQDPWLRYVEFYMQGGWDLVEPP